MARKLGVWLIKVNRIASAHDQAIMTPQACAAILSLLASVLRVFKGGLGVDFGKDTIQSRCNWYHDFIHLHRLLIDSALL